MDVNKSAVLDVNKICRACLVEKQDMSSIHDGNIKDMFIYCTSLMIETTDDLQSSICHECKVEMKRAYVFKQLCVQSLLQLISMKDSNKSTCELEPKQVKNLTCNVCQEIFDLSCDYETHLISHPEDNSPYCTSCNKTFLNLKVLKWHVRIHMVNKLFPCKLCDKTFSELGSLT